MNEQAQQAKLDASVTSVNAAVIHAGWMFVGFVFLLALLACAIVVIKKKPGNR